MVNVDDEGFGDFKMSPLNSTIHSNPTMVDGRDSPAAAANDDDDWGDFVNSGGLPHALSLPEIWKPLDPLGFATDQKMKRNDSESNQLGSAPGRVNSGIAEWEKPKGALPLSLFGDLEEEEEKESGAAGDPSFGDGGASLFSSKNVDSVNKGSGVIVNELVANLYKQNDPRNGSIADFNGSNSVEKTNKNETCSDLNLSSLNLGVVEPIRNAHPSDLSWDRVNPNANVLNANGKDELKLSSHWSNFDWGPLNLNTNVINSNKDGANLVTEGVKSSTKGANSISVADTAKCDNGGGGGNGDGWEFEDTQAKNPASDEISKVRLRFL